MKSRIHNIFSETGCVQKDMLLNYRDGKLNESDKHDIERHLIDCELCSDALEGLAMLTSIKVLDEVSTEVKQTVQSPKGIYISPQWRTVMIAASVSIIAFLSFYTVKQFEEAKTPENIITQVEEKAKPESMKSNGELNDDKSIVTTNELESNQIINEGDTQARSEAPSAPKTPKPSNITVQVSDADQSDTEPLIEEVFIAEDDSEMELPEEVIESNELEKNKSSFNTISAESRDGNNQGFSKKENLGAGSISPNSNVGYLNDHKIFTNAAPLVKDKKPAVKSKSLSPKYENKSVTTPVEEPTIVREELTYEQVLEQALIDFDNERYDEALAKLKLIEKKYPNDLNVDFYSGMSNYNLSNFSDAISTLEPITKDTNKVFNEEAEYYTALSHFNLGNTRKGVKMLEKISSQNNFYSPKAKEFLEKNKK